MIRRRFGCIKTLSGRFRGMTGRGAPFEAGLDCTGGLSEPRTEELEVLSELAGGGGVVAERLRLGCLPGEEVCREGIGILRTVSLLEDGGGLPEAIARSRASLSAKADDEWGLTDRPDATGARTSLSTRLAGPVAKEAAGGVGGAVGSRCSSIRARGARRTCDARLLRCLVGTARALFLRCGVNMVAFFASCRKPGPGRNDLVPLLLEPAGMIFGVNRVRSDLIPSRA